MPIDDALDKIKENQQEKKNLEENLINAPSGLFAKAHELLGRYLTDVYFKNIKYKNIQLFLKTLGPFMLKIHPYEDGQTSSLVDLIDGATWLQCLKTFSDGYLENTDIVKDFKLEEEIQYVPELAAVKLILLKTNVPPDTNPYVLVMGMTPKYRPLVAVTIETAIKKHEINIYDESVVSNEKERLFSSIPTLKSIADTAKEFDVTNLKEIVQDLNKVVQEYNEQW